MRIPIMNLDTIGIIADLSPVDLPLSAWSAGRNVRFEDGKATPSAGHRVLFDTAAIPLHLVEAPDWSNPDAVWYYGDRNRLYYRPNNLETVFDRSRPIPAGQSTPYNNQQFVEARWQSTLFNGVLIMTNGVDCPQMLNSSRMFEDLSNWPHISVDLQLTPLNAISLRGFKNYLVALGAERYSSMRNIRSQRVLWSHPADPGTIPISWAIDDPTKDSGDFYLAETPGPVIDQGELRGRNVIYKTDAVHIMSLVGGIDIMGQVRMAKGPGILTRNALANFRSRSGDMHFVMGPTEVYVNDGVSLDTPFRKRLQKWIYRQLTSENMDNVWVVNNIAKNEIWLGVPEGGAQYPRVAVIWNYVDNTISFRDLPGENGCPAAAVGRIGYDMRKVSQNISDEEFKNHPSLLFAPTGSQQRVFVADRGTTFEGAAVTSMLERRGLTVAGVDRQTGKPIYDTDVTKLVTEVWPRVEGLRGDVMNIYVGAQDNQTKPISWSGPFPFRIGIDDKVDPVVSGKIISTRFEITSFNEWKFNGYDLELKPLGKY